MELLILKLVNSFNSMKVRLKHFIDLESWFLDQFQFHEGPIKTCFNFVRLGQIDVFQFHEGPIKTQRLRSLLQGGGFVSIP